jgi:hypothetical protein
MDSEFLLAPDTRLLAPDKRRLHTLAAAAVVDHRYWMDTVELMLGRGQPLELPEDRTSPLDTRYLLS